MCGDSVDFQMHQSTQIVLHMLTGSLHSYLIRDYMYTVEPCLTDTPQLTFNKVLRIIDNIIIVHCCYDYINNLRIKVVL